MFQRKNNGISPNNNYKSAKTPKFEKTKFCFGVLRFFLNFSTNTNRILFIQYNKRKPDKFSIEHCKQRFIKAKTVATGHL